MRPEDYADSAQARSWDQERRPAVNLENDGGDTFAETCRKTREADAKAFGPRLKTALNQMEAFYNGRKEG